MAKGQWWEDLKNPPNWIAPSYLVLAILMTGFTASQVVRGRDWFLSTLLSSLFWYKAWANCYQRRKVAKSQQPKPE